MAVRSEAITFSDELNTEDLIEWLRVKLLEKGTSLTKKMSQTLRDADINGGNFAYLNDMQIAQLGFNIKQQLVISSIVKSLYFEVRATFNGAKVRKGIRASMYMYAEQHQAYYSSEHAKSIWYDDDSNDLHIAVVFEKKDLALKFQTFLAQFYLSNPIVKQNDISVEEKLNVVYVANKKRLLLAKYDGEEYDSPVMSLEEFSAIPLSHSSLSAVSANDPLAQFQSLEHPPTGTRPYKCHIKDKSVSKDLSGNENNLILGSWLFHQYFDGLMTEDKSGLHDVPQIAIRADSDEQLRDESVGEPPVKRTRVSVLVECRSDDIAKQIGGFLKNGSEMVTKDVWKTFVHVQDSKVFCDCLEWKYNKTKRRWKEIEDSD